jgi:hypothetical protein
MGNHKFNATQKKAIFRCLIVCTVLTVLHNPLSGYEPVPRRSSEPHRTTFPVGVSADNNFGYLNLGLVSTYGSALIGTLLITAVFVMTTRKDGE